MSETTTLKLVNATPNDVEVWLTIGTYLAASNPSTMFPFVTTRVKTLQGSFHLAGNQSVSYVPPAGTGISGNFAFGYAPANCPAPEYKSGMNLAELFSTTDFQGAGAKETLDISAVAGVNALVWFDLAGGGPWNAGRTQPNITALQ